MREITRTMNVEITPTVEEIAQAIWDMDAQEQYELLGALFIDFFKDEMAGNMQLLGIREKIDKDVNRQFSVGVLTFIYRMYEYLYEKE